MTPNGQNAFCVFALSLIDQRWPYTASDLISARRRCHGQTGELAITISSHMSRMGKRKDMFRGAGRCAGMCIRRCAPLAAIPVKSAWRFCGLLSDNSAARLIDELVVAVDAGAVF